MTTPNANTESQTTKIPNDQLEAYFNRFTKHFLLAESTNRVDVEVLAADWGDQFEAQGARVIGITYEPKKNSLEFALENGDHRVEGVKEVWTSEEPDGFVKTISVVRADGTRDIATIKRLGVAPAPSATRSLGTSQSDRAGPPT